MVETPSRGGIVMKAWRLGGGLLLALLLIAGHTAAQPGYRWVDEHGNVHYVGRRDQVPERYRDQLTPERRGEPPRPTLAPSAPPSAGGGHRSRFRAARHAGRRWPRCAAKTPTAPNASRLRSKATADSSSSVEESHGLP